MVATVVAKGLIEDAVVKAMDKNKNKGKANA